MGMKPYLLALGSVIALCIATPALAASSAATWPVKPGKAPRLRPPMLAVQAPQKRNSTPRAARAPLDALRLARAIAQALRKPDPAPPVSGRVVAKAAPKARPKPRKIKRLARRPSKHAARYKRPRPKAPPFPPPLRPAEVSQPVFMDEGYVQQPGATLFGAYNKGQPVGRLPAATRVTQMGRHGKWVKVEAPNGTVGFIAARAIGPTPPNW